LQFAGLFFFEIKQEDPLGMERANGSFPARNENAVVWTPLKTCELFWLDAIGGNHAVKPANITVLASGGQVEVLVNNPLINRRLMGHDFVLP
jgi:hypothetical protein